MASQIARRRHRHWLWILLLGLVPVFAIGAYAGWHAAQAHTRYAPAYFAAEYQERYAAPGAVARAWELALQTSDPLLVEELTGLRNPPRIEPNPDIILTILLDTDAAGYYHYLYMDLDTYQRATYYIKEVRGRWVVVPEDLYFYWDSGRWQAVVSPIVAVWWLVLLVAGVAISLFRIGAGARESMLR
jgi:hypothetical protein